MGGPGLCARCPATRFPSFVWWGLSRCICAYTIKRTKCSTWNILRVAQSEIPLGGSQIHRFRLSHQPNWGPNLPGSPVVGMSDSVGHLTQFVIPVLRWSDGTEGRQAGPCKERISAGTKERTIK